MNPILHDLQNKQWIWTAAFAKQEASKSKLKTGFENLDKVLSGGFPHAGLIHLQSPLGCGEMRLMLSAILHQSNGKQQHNSQQLFVFINPPFAINAEFLLANNIPLERLVVLKPAQCDEALWCAEQCAKSGACHSVFLWQQHLKHIQIRKLEHAAQQGASYCVWMHNQNASSKSSAPSNLPLSLSLSITREYDSLNITVNKQKVGWAQKAVKVPLPFNSRTNARFNQEYGLYAASHHNKVVPIRANK